MAEPLVIFQHVDGKTGITTLTVETWSRETEIDAYVLETADAAVMRRDGQTLTVTVSNGQATYEMGDVHIDRLSYPARLISARLSER